MQEEIDLLRIILVLGFFIYASVSDWRTRRVPDKTWLLLGTIGLAILLADLLSREANLIAISVLLPVAFIFYDIFWDRESGLKSASGIVASAGYIASFIWTLYILVSVVGDSIEWSAEVSGPVVAFFIIILFELFYMFDVIKGGADAKAAICLAILFPWYPALVSGLPIITPSIEGVDTLFPFALSVLFIAAVISVITPIYYISRNLKFGEAITGRALVGFKLPLEEVEKHFVWLIEWMDGEEHRFSARKPRDSATLAEDLDALGRAGIRQVWVTYKIPFIIPMTIAIVIILVLGNPLFTLY